MSSVTETTPVFVRLEYLIRGTLIFEAVKWRSEFNDDLSLSLNALADINLVPGVPSPYQMVVDYQTPISCIAYNSTLPPKTRMSADGQTISYKHKNLYFPRYKQGIHDGIAKCTKRLEKLMYGMSIPVDMPARPEDDWAEERRGYSFLDLHTYLGLLKLKPDGGVLVDSNGRPLFNQKALHEVLNREAKFIDVFMPTVYMASSSNRGTQFGEAKIRNSTRGRNVFIDTDGNIWLVTRRLKEETRTIQETFVPVMLPPSLSKLFLQWITVIRPGNVELIWINLGEEAAMLHSEYLWTRSGQLVNTDQFTFLLKEFTFKNCGVGLKNRVRSRVDLEGAWR
ncbi:hypothetical protein C8J57DRAFT_1494298 [Mycena rebaudengoi]|nr:hypothetical protein C8J57DRAFT_1494298 [Mycena rebaudengoi]